MTQPNFGNQIDAVLKGPWLLAWHGLEALAGKVEGDVKTQLQAEQTNLVNAMNNASSAVSAAQSKVDATVNPIVNNALQVAGKAIASAYPPFALLVAAAEPEIETLADGGTDAILLALIEAGAKLLSNGAKSIAAVKLSNLAGAQ